MRVLSFIFLLSAIIGCSSPGREIEGVWKVDDVWTEGEDRFLMAEFIRANMKNLYFSYDDSNTAVIIEKDTVNSFPYQIIKDTLVVHTKGNDIRYTLKYPADDTLFMKDKDGIVMKLHKLKNK